MLKTQFLLKKVEQEEYLTPIKNKDKPQNSPTNWKPIHDFSYDLHFDNEINCQNG
ncbi:unnamed protein product [Paramecium sonneborni]|uniref:Uncharacterized protein n=1 Tax=Paramecium sonneborni TaxID=65129 RepID=A0A8S1R8W6_9CILI|nr:unnamed protein product [Paramecium sonneborni]